MSAVLGSRRRVAPQPSSLAIRPVLFLTGGMLVALAATMLAPMALDFFVGDEHWKVFAASSVVTFLCGLAALQIFHCRLEVGLTLRQAFLLTPFAWSTVAVFAALPLYFSGYQELSGSFTNSLFESMAGLTTMT